MVVVVGVVGVGGDGFCVRVGVVWFSRVRVVVVSVRSFFMGFFGR